MKSPKVDLGKLKKEGIFYSWIIDYNFEGVGDYPKSSLKGKRLG